MKTLLLLLLTGTMYAQVWQSIPPLQADTNQEYYLKHSSLKLCIWRYYIITPDTILIDTIREDHDTYKRFNIIADWLIEVIIYNNNNYYDLSDVDTLYHRFTTDITTGIAEIKEAKQDNIVYDLQGRRVDYMEPNKLYIKNRKLIFGK